MQRRAFLRSTMLGAAAIAARGPALDARSVHFEDNEVKRIVSARAGAKCYYVSVVDGKVVERVMEPDSIV